MCNSVTLGEGVLPDVKDGEKVELTIKGKVVREGDKTKVEITQADGEDVGDPTDCGCGDEEESPEDLMNQDSGDALQIFMIKNRKKK